MNKIQFTLITLLFTLSLRAADKPNILIIMADDMGYSDLGCYGGEIQTPSMDQLATNGVRFTQMYNCARCCPSRASLLTGQYPQKVGITGMGVNLAKNAATIAEVLKENGYHTGMTGKWHLSETKALNNETEHLKWLANQVDHGPFAPLETYPSNRGFEEHWGVIWGVVNFFDPFSLVHNTERISKVPEDFYMTDFITEKTINLLDKFSEDDDPFFLYVAHTAPHWPLHALPEDIAKYKDSYKDGWEVLRENRYKRMLELGILDEESCSLPLNSSGRSWSDCQEKEYEAACMAVHAAMVDHVDQSVGEIIQKLKDLGEYENTLILVLSDNGASYERGYPPGFDRPGFTRDGTNIEYNSTNPGAETTWNYIGKAWASASNTPFRFWKMESYAGGTSTPFIVHWPEGLKGKENTINRGVAHVIDIMPTCLELAGVGYPDKINGESTNPLDGKSLIPLLTKETESIHDTLYWEHQGGKAIRVGDWKLVSLPNSSWELYNLSVDASENNDLSDQNLQKVFQMSDAWEAWAIKVGLKKPISDSKLELLFHYPFNGNNKDASKNEYSLESPKGQKYKEGKFGEALELNGNNQYLDLKNSILNPSNTAFTTCAWVKNTSEKTPDSNSFYEEVILAQLNGANDATGRIFLYYRLNNDAGVFNNFLGANANLSAKGSFKRNEWIHVTAVCDPQNQTVKYYINGEKNAICYTPPFESCTGGFRIGAHKTGDKNFWKGYIDELYLFKGKLSEAEIKKVMNNQFETTTSNKRFQSSSFSVFPNPVKHQLNVEGIICSKLEFFNIDGKKILASKNSNTLNTSTIKPGSYIVKIQTHEGLNASQKIIVQ